MARTAGNPIELGTPGHHVVEVNHELVWQQRLDEITLTLTNHRTCATRSFAPVIRTAHIERRADGAYYWEWGLGLVLTAIGVVGMAAPQAISSTGLDENGQPEKDLSTGYRLGGIMGSLGLILVGAAIYDTVRARDQYIYTEAYEPVPGPPVACAQPVAPAARQEVELIIGEYQIRKKTDDQGEVRFRLPLEPTIPPGADRILVRGALRVGPRRALTFDYIAPYGLTVKEPHRGRRAPDDG